MFTSSSTRRAGRSLLWPSPSKARGGLPRTSSGLMVLFCGLLAVLTAAPLATAQPILEVYNRTLTFYDGNNASLHQNLWPRDWHRGTNIDGIMRAGPTVPWACAGNPYGEGWDGNNKLMDVRLDLGTYNPTDVDIALPCPGASRWVIGRSFNGRQWDLSADFTSNGYQGKNWMQTSDPELVLGSGPASADDVLYIVYGADRFLELQRIGTGSDYFKGKNGTAGVVKHTAGSLGASPFDPSDDTPELYEYYDQNGTISTFFGTIGAYGASWHLWKITDAAGNVSFVGDASNSLTARSGYSNEGVGTAYDAAGRRYTYAYTASIAGVARLAQVKVETKTGGTWTGTPTGVTTVAQVDYAYYTATVTDVGRAGDLKLVTITTPLTDSGVNLVQKKYYRYYTQAWANTTGQRGDPHQIKMVMSFEGTRSYDWVDTTLDDDFLNDSESSIKPYSEAYFEYIDATDADNPLKIKTAYFNGQCGCSGGSGTYTFEYALNPGFSPTSSYDTAWYSRTVVAQPDGTYFTQYFDETGQPLSRVVTDAVPTSYTKLWATYAARNSDGQLTRIDSPAHISTGYTHDSGGTPSGAFTTSGGTGLVTTFNRVSSGDMTGFPEASLHQDGTGTAYFDSWTSYTSRALAVSTATVVRPFIEKRRAYYVETSTYSTSNTYDETIVFDTSSATWWSATSTNVLYIAPKKMVTSYPVVTSGTNGSNAATTTTRYLRTDGTTALTVNQEGISSYSKFTNGQVVMSIEDVKTNDATDIDVANDDPNSVFGITETGDGIHRKTLYAYDPQGRSDTVTMPDTHLAKNYYSLIKDGRMATLSFPASDTSTTVWYGPVGYTISNLLGKPALRCTLAMSSSGIDTSVMGKAYTDWITETTADPLDALSSDFTGASRVNVNNLSTSLYDSPGVRLAETRSYFNIITSSSWTGTAGTDYDASTIVYDDQGRTIRATDPTGTIARTSYDVAGRAYRSYLGTDDTGDAGSTMAGTNNMVKVSETEFDGGVDHGNSYATTRTAFVQNSTTDQRVTTLAYDYRGRALLITNPQSPHILTKYDNRGRATASAQYSSTASITPGTTDPAGSATNDKANRLNLSETLYDARGQVYQSIRHKITQSTGADASDSLTTYFWFDPVGRQIKVMGEQYSKARYDRVGRAIRQFTLATDNDSGTYSNIYSGGQTDVAGDTVMEEVVTGYEDSTNSVLIQAVIMRHPTDTTTTGGLDTNADADPLKFTGTNIKGRIQMTANWYDSLHRLTSSVNYGTNLIVGDGSTSTGTLDRTGLSVPTGDATHLRTDYAYDTAGRVKDVTDPRGKVARTLFDAAGRKIASIANYVNGTPSGVNGDDDVYTRYDYTNGLMTAMWVDLDGDNVKDTSPADQVTKYQYGVSRTASVTPSTVSSGRMLRAVIYPDSTNATATAATIDAGSGSGSADIVTFAYNALGQELLKQDQAANVIETVYDTGGRLTDKRFTTISTGAGFDDLVKRISCAYVARGMTDTVTQYDNATVGSGTAKDQVQYTYDDWGNLTKFEQDVDGIIGAGGRAAFNVQYAYAKSAPSAGRQTWRRTSQTLPGSLTMSYGYGGTINDKLSRLDDMLIVSTSMVGYSYTGAGMVVGTSEKQPGAESINFNSGTTGSYPNLDQFNRVTQSRWVKNIGGSNPTFYSVDIAYDENSNVVSTVDNIHRAASGASANRAYDVLYTLDGLNRVTLADEGTLSGTISNRTRTEGWTLTQTGNFAENKLDLNGDLDFADGGEVDDTRTHNTVNEILAWTPAGTTYTAGYDAAGNLTDDGKDYLFVYDVVGRLRKITNRSSNLVAEYRYNGLGYRIAWHYDVDSDLTVENTSDDPWFYFCSDERWRIVATFRDTDSDPKERFVYQAAGLGGYGGSSYIDGVVFRDKDDNSGWASAADGTLEQRHYYCQNWRQDLSAVVTSTGVMVEWVKYFSYGTPMGLPAGDTDSNGLCNSTDTTNINSWSGAPYDVRADVNLDGAINGSDSAILPTGKNMGKDVLSRSDINSRKGYAGYENSFEIPRFDHVRHRVKDALLARWLNRDPAGYVDGTSCYSYAADDPIKYVDSQGLQCSTPLTTATPAFCSTVSRSSASIGCRVIAPRIRGVCLALATPLVIEDALCNVLIPPTVPIGCPPSTPICYITGRPPPSTFVGRAAGTITIAGCAVPLKVECSSLACLESVFTGYCVGAIIRTPNPCCSPPACIPDPPQSSTSPLAPDASGGLGAMVIKGK